MKKLLLALCLLFVALQMNANEKACVYPATEKYEKLIAQWQNDHGWQGDCYSRFLGKDFAQNGLNMTALKTLAYKHNLALKEGEPPVDPKLMGQGMIALYEAYQPENFGKYAKEMSQLMIEEVYSKFNPFASMGIILNPVFFSDPGCYEKNGTLAYETYEALQISLFEDFFTFLAQIKDSYGPHCDRLNPDPDYSFEQVCDFLDGLYAYCLQITGQ